MSGFKLLAIRPMAGNPDSIIKNLIEGAIYTFYNSFEYSYSDSKNKLSEIIKCKLNLINVENIFSTGKRNINISAIVGKNGSGKSSVIELFYATCYSISIIDGKLEDISKGIDKKKTGDVKLLDNIFIYKMINCQIYFSKDNKIYRINLKNGKYIWEEYLNNKWNKKNLKYSDFAYSIAINYSLYGLNSNQHQWISSLFHKNDGYQIPVVINPFRKAGIVDVNSELHLAQSRILLNLSANKEDNPVIINEKTINKVEFTMDISENDSIRITSIFEHSFKNIIKNHFEKHNQTIFELFNAISYQLIRYKLTSEEINSLQKIYALDIAIESRNKFLYSDIKSNPLYYNFNNSIRVKYEFIKYVIRKVYKICINYPNEFGKHLVKQTEVSTKNPPEITNLKQLILDLNADDSHVTLKLRQALYSIKEKYFERRGWQQISYFHNAEKVSYKINLDWKIVKGWINDSVRKSRKKLEDKLELVPGAFVKPAIKIKDNKKDYSYDLLSSGEQQLANTIQTIIYHLYNINSVHRSRGNRIKYNNINIILDEIELYFHPEFQRKFIFELVKTIEKLNLNKIYDINVLLATHSPFILSDIPNVNILKLSNGKPDVFDNAGKTFGANIHELLSEKFFLSSSIGEFAKEKVNEIINFYSDFRNSDRKQLDNFRKVYNEKKLGFEIIVENIGEDFIKGILENNLEYLNDNLSEK